MKTRIATLAILMSLLTFSSFAMNSQLNLRMFDNSRFYFVFDGQKYNSNTNSYQIFNITPGNHMLKVFKIMGTPYGNNGNVAKVIFTGNVFIPAGKEVFGVIDRFNRFSIVRQIPIKVGNGHGNHGNNGHNGNNCYGYGQNGYYSQYYYNTNTYYNTAPACLTNRDIQQLKMTMRRTAFDESKLQIAKQAIRANRIEARDVLELMNELTFESSKLKLAKFAYNYTIDKNRYFLVNNGFTFESSIRQLNIYIQSQNR
ncbi:MAG: DUF4476 domain-containing protein [Saprospiraceae bacterium]|nr:DUF4476 domain-containing protein [Saprospiraceae bacterium]